ncbi:hypothetical protein P4544_13875 [Halomonas sp. LY9]
MGTKNWLKRCLPPRPADALEGAPVKAWSLDYPSAEREACFVAAGRVVQGWVLFDDAAFADSAERDAVLSSTRVAVGWDAIYELSHPLEVARPDVIEKVLKVEPSQHAQRHCGFRFSIPHRVKRFKLWLVIDDQRWLLKDIAIEEEGNTPLPSVLKVLEGREGWLFLDNDTNGSVDQYAGRLLLTEEGVGAWQHYLQEVERQAHVHQACYAVLVAPSKESVMGPRYHPYTEGDGGPISQLLGLPGEFPFVYPVPELSAMGDDAFIQTDTHWTQQGAMAASKALAEKLELDSKSVVQLFASDHYRKRVLTGDLGNKFEPPRQCEVPILTSFSYTKCRYYDNGLPNFGRLLVLVNDDALVKETCLIFGSSSSYSMFHYLCRLFHRVVFVHSAGSLDQALISAVKPAYLVIQTNARFVVQVPSLEQSVEKMIIDKRARLSDEELEMVAKRQICPPADDVLLAELNLTPWLI